MSKKKKATSITSQRNNRPKRSGQRASGRARKARIFGIDEKSGAVVFNGDVNGRSPKELAAEMADPLAEAIKAVKPRTSVDVVIFSDDGEGKMYFVDSKAPAKGKGRSSKAAASGAAGKMISLQGRRMVGKSIAYRSAEHLGHVIAGPSTDELAERMLPESPVPSPAQAALAQRESQARWSMLEEFGAFTSEELADQRSEAKNRHALANRWRSEGKVFAVEVRGRRLFPGFQFDPMTFAPEPVIAETLAALPSQRMSDWEVALWWVAADPWLEGGRPVDVMHEDPGAVVTAAAGLAEDSPL